jgi:type II secretory pathway pseudopilin PulG
MAANPRNRIQSIGAHAQRGVTTLMVVLVLLVILTVIVLASANVSLFDQRTAVNENRARLAEQAAEYALNIGGNFMKANVTKIPTIGAGGWLDTVTAANRRWSSCAPFTNSAYNAASATNRRHPCYAEPDEGRRLNLYYYTTTGGTTTNGADTILNVYDSASPPALIPAGARLTQVGGSAAFPVTTVVRALLCRLDTTTGSLPTCQLNPASGNRFAVTLIAESTLPDESASAVVKETWATFNAATATSAVPLVAAGIVEGLGNATIVAAPNAGGYGLPGSIWSPRDVDVDDSGSGIGSISTCHLGDYLGSVPAANLKTTCAGNGNTGCGCPAVSTSGSDFLSGHSQSVKRENVDILDVDGQPAGQPLPDIQFFPGHNAANVRMDDPNDTTDDNLFEWIFGVDVTGGNGDTVLNNCGGGSTNCEVAALSDMGATTIASCASLNSASTGIFYVTGTCNLPSQVGSPTNSAIVVVDDSVTVGSNSLFYGMLFVRSTTSPNPTAELTGHGNPKIFGSLVVEGEVTLTGNLDLIYSDTGAANPGDAPPESTRFARVPGTWFDSMRGN